MVQKKLKNSAFLRNNNDLHGTKILTIKTENEFVKYIRKSVEEILLLVRRFFEKPSQAEKIVLLAKLSPMTLNQIDNELKKIENKIGKRLLGIMTDSIGKAYNRGINTAQQQINRIKSIGKFVPTSKDKQLINTLNNTNFNLIKTMNSSHIAEARAIFAEGLINGLSQKEIINEMITRLRATEYQARRIVRTEITRTANTASRKRYLDANLEFWQWNTAQDERVCPICGPLHGKAVPIGETFNRFLTGKGIQLNKGNQLNEPPAHPFCRCGVSPAFNLTRKTSIQQAKEKIPKAKIKGFTKDEKNELEKFIETIPLIVKKEVKSLNGTYPIRKVKGILVDDDEVKSIISPVVRQKYRDVVGFYIGSNVNKIFVSEDIEIDEILHEIGHAIYDEYINLRAKKKNIWEDIHNQHLQSGDFITPRSSINPKEHFADAIRFYLDKPAQLKFKFPEIYDYLMKNIFVGNETGNIVTLEDSFFYKNKKGIWKEFRGNMYDKF